MIEKIKIVDWKDEIDGSDENVMKRSLCLLANVNMNKPYPAKFQLSSSAINIDNHH